MHKVASVFLLDKTNQIELTALPNLWVLFVLSNIKRYVLCIRFIKDRFGVNCLETIITPHQY